MPGLLEQPGGLAHRPPLLPHRVLGAGDEEHRQVLGNAPDALRRRGFGSQVRKGGVGPGAKRRAGQGIVLVGAHHGGVAGQPVQRGLRVRDGPAEAADDDGFQKRAAEILTAHGPHEPGQKVAHARHRHGHVAGAADNGRAHPAAVAGEEGPRDEASHGVAEHDVGNVGAHLGQGKRAQGLHVCDQMLLGVGAHMPQVGFRGGRATVADVVLGADGEALAHQKAREVVVASDMLLHAVDNLHERPRASARHGRPRPRCGRHPALPLPRPPRLLRPPPPLRPPLSTGRRGW